MNIIYYNLFIIKNIHMTTENEKNSIENENSETSNELIELKEDLAEEIVDSLLKKKQLNSTIYSTMIYKRLSS